MARLRFALLFLLCTGACRDSKLAPVEASGALAPVNGNSTVNGEITVLQLNLRSHLPGDAETWTRLARAFVRKARQDSDPRYYQQADDAATRALKLDAESSGALQVRQAVLLADHRFAEARQLATQQIKKQPRDAVAWGVVGDSALELGDYPTAEQAYQTMIDLKPDLRSYNRGAWMRWLLGDGEGAIELMQLSIGAQGARESEPRAFCRVQLGDLYFNRGQYVEAQKQYDLALRDQPGYVAAYLARGRLALGQKTPQGLSDGIADVAAALKIQPSTAARALHIDALLQAGRSDEAQRETAILEAEGPREDPRTTALFLAMHRQKLDQALALAQQAVSARPDIWSYDVLGWAAYRNGQLPLAWDAVQKATRLNTPDPRLRFHLGAVALARGDKDRGVKELRTALSQNPRWDVSEAAEARALLLQAGETPPESAPQHEVPDGKPPEAAQKTGQH